MLLKCAEYGVWYKVGPRRKAGLGNRTLLVGIRSLDFILRATEDTRGVLKPGKSWERVW